MLFFSRAFWIKSFSSKGIYIIWQLAICFQERDKNQSGRITLEQLEDIFRIYQVDLDEKTIAKVTDERGEVSKEDFVRIALENKLLDFGNVMGGDHIKNTQKKISKNSNYTTGQEIPSGKVKIHLTRFEDMMLSKHRNVKRIFATANINIRIEKWCNAVMQYFISLNFYQKYVFVTCTKFKLYDTWYDTHTEWW